MTIVKHKKAKRANREIGVPGERVGRPRLSRGQTIALPLRLRPGLYKLVCQEARRLANGDVVRISRQQAVLSILERYFRERLAASITDENILQAAEWTIAEEENK